MEDLRREAKRTPVDVGELDAALQALEPALTKAARCVLLAQWALETGRGKSCYNYNIGNIKANTDTRLHTYFPTFERLENKLAQKYVLASTLARIITVNPSGNSTIVRFWPDHPMCRFRAYDSLQDGAADYVGMLKKRFAVAWPAVLDGDPVAFAQALKKAKYYTADVGVYAKNMASLWREYMDKLD